MGPESAPPSFSKVVRSPAGGAIIPALVARIVSDPSLYEIVTFDHLASRVAQALVS